MMKLTYHQEKVDLVSSQVMLSLPKLGEEKLNQSRPFKTTLRIRCSQKYKVVKEIASLN